MGLLIDSLFSMRQLVQQHVLFSCSLLILGLYFWRYLHTSKRAKAVNAPIVGVNSQLYFSTFRARLAYVTKGFHLLQVGYDEHSQEIFQVPTINQDLLVLPPKYVEELKSVPETVMSSSQAVADYFLGSYTTLSINLFGHVVWDVLRGNLTQNLGNLVEPLHDECRRWFDHNLTNCEDWTPVQIHPTLLQIVGRTTARVFVGKRLCQNKLWLDTSIDFATCIFQGSGVLKITPWFLRPLAALFTPYIYRIHRHHRNARLLLIPEIERRRSLRMEQGPNGSLKEKEDEKACKDMLDWLDEASEGDELFPERIVDRQLGMSFAAIHTTTNNLANILLDLAARWDEYGPELRAEIEDTIRESNGILEKTTVTKFSKLDSFMKESQRMNPPSARRSPFSFNRKLMNPYTLSDNRVLPASVYIAVASGPMARSETYHHNAGVFDGFRFHRLRQEAATEPGKKNGAYLFASTGVSSLIFGHGKHACPGRFFAGLETKMILAEIITRFDLSLPEGTGRPKNLIFADANFPDPKNILMFRNRKMSKTAGN